MSEKITLSCGLLAERRDDFPADDADAGCDYLIELTNPTHARITYLRVRFTAEMIVAASTFPHDRGATPMPVPLVETGRPETGYRCLEDLDPRWLVECAGRAVPEICALEAERARTRRPTRPRRHSEHRPAAPVPTPPPAPAPAPIPVPSPADRAPADRPATRSETYLQARAESALQEERSRQLHRNATAAATGITEMLRLADDLEAVVRTLQGHGAPPAKPMDHDTVEAVLDEMRHAISSCQSALAHRHHVQGLLHHLERDHLQRSREAAESTDRWSEQNLLAAG